MNEIRVRVYRFNSKAEDETLYRNSITMPTGVMFPYDDMVRSLSLLYPKSLIEFTSSSL